MTLEARARGILGLDQPEQPHPFLSVRVENLWRLEGFAPVVPFSGSIFAPMGRDLDIGILRDAILTVMRRHDVLHSRLALSGNRPVLITDDVKAPDLQVVSVPRAVITAYREGGEPSPLSEFVDAPVDLLAEPGFRCRVFRDEDGNFTLGMGLHHYFGDGWSSQILRREIAAAYAALAQNQAPQLPDAAQYADYARAQRQALAANLAAPLSYWQQRLADIAPSHLPYDHVRDTNQMGRLYFGIGEEAAAGLTALSQSLRVSIFTVYLAAFRLLLASWSGERDIVTAVNTADRAKPQFQNIVGYLIASVPLYTKFQESASLAELLPATAKSFFDGYGHRDLSYDLYDAIAEPPQPFCTTLFNFIPLQDKLSAAKSQSAAAPPSGLISGLPIQRVRVHREIYFCLVEQPRGMVGKIYYNLDFFNQGSMEALITRFQTILVKMAAGPDTRLSEIL